MYKICKYTHVYKGTKLNYYIDIKLRKNFILYQETQSNINPDSIRIIDPDQSRVCRLL